MMQHLDGEDQRRLRLLFVTSAGGHLAQLMQLGAWSSQHDRCWVTFKLPDAENLLTGERVYWGYHPTTRSVRNLVRNGRLAWRVIRRERPDVIVSCGAAIAVPFFVIGRLHGARTTYVEVVDRLNTRTLTSRLVSPFTDLFATQDEQQAELFPGSVQIGRLL